MTVSGKLIAVEVCYNVVGRGKVFKCVFSISFIALDKKNVSVKLAANGRSRQDKGRNALDLIRALGIIDNV